MRPILRKALIALIILVVIVGGLVFYALRGNPSDRPIADTTGLDPVLVEPEPRWFPSVSLAEPVGWDEGETPVAAEGLRVSRFADKLAHPRTMLTLPNGDVLVAETNSPPRDVGDMQQTVDTAKIHEGAVFSDVLDHAIEYLTFLEIGKQFGPSLGA